MKLLLMMLMCMMMMKLCFEVAGDDGVCCKVAVDDNIVMYICCRLW